MISPERSLSAEKIAAAVEEYGLTPLDAGVPERFSAYFDLLQVWNAKLNLTAIRDAEDALRRHFVECIFCAQNLPSGLGTLMDYGSGGGFPGIPIALCRPEIRVTLAESQAKKASFLREAVRALHINAEVYAGRVEDMEPERRFDAVAMRAVDKMQMAIDGVSARVADSGWLVVLAGRGGVRLPEGFRGRSLPIPGSTNGELLLSSRGRGECST